jgi:hypothetical protein
MNQKDVPFSQDVDVNSTQVFLLALVLKAFNIPIVERKWNSPVFNFVLVKDF